MAERPHDPARSTATSRATTAGTRDFETYDDFDLPTYVGPATFMNLPWITDPAELRAPGVDVAIVGAPFDDAVSHRPGARFGPRAIREAQYTSGSIHSLQLDVDPFDVLTVVDAGDANIVPAWIERGHAMIYRKVREVAETGAIPIVLGGDHSITWPSATAIAEVRRPGSIGIVHFDAHADTATDTFGVLASHGTPMRRLIESGAVKGKNFVQVGLRGYWPPPGDLRLDAGAGPALALHARDRGARRRGGHRRRDRRGARRPGRDLPLARHRRHRPGHGARHRDARAGRHADPRGPPRDPPDRRRGRPRRDGHRRGLAAVRPGRDDRDGRQPRRARGDQRARRQAPRPAAASAGRADHRSARRSIDPTPRPRPPSPACTTSTSPTTRATSTCTSRSPTGPTARSSSCAVGTGRLAIPLAEAGHPVTGVDLDPAMLDRARARARGTAGEDRLTLVEADIVGLRLPDAGRFGLAFIALNSLLVLPTRAAQRAAARAPWPTTSRPGGLAVVDVWLPDADDLARFDGRIILEWPRLDPETGAIVTKAGSAQHDAASGQRHPDDDLRGGRPGRAGPPLGPPRPAAPRLGRRAARLRRGRRADRRAARRRLRHGPAGARQRARDPARRQALTRPAARPDRPTGAGPPGRVPATDPRGIVRPMPPSDQTRLLIVEDVPQVAQYIRGLLNAQPAGQAARRPDRRQPGDPDDQGAAARHRPRRRAAPGPDQGPPARRADPRGRARRPGHRPDRAAEPDRARRRRAASTASCRCRSPAST